MGRLGDASTVPFLLRDPAEDRELKGAVVGPHLLAMESLRDLRGEGVLEALLSAARDGKPQERNTAIGALRLRRERSSVPLLLKIVQEPDSGQHLTAQHLAASNALLAIKELADPRSLPVLVELLVKPKNNLAQRDIQEAIIETCRHMENKDAATAPVLAALRGAAAPARCALLGVLASVPSAKSLEALRAAVNDGNADVKDTAIYGLAVWPDPAAAPDLLAIAGSNKNPKQKLLALRGAIRLGGPAGKLPAEQAVKLLADAMKLAARTEEKKLALAALGEVKHPAAIELAARCLADPELEVEAATAVVKTAKSLRVTHPDAATAAIQKVLDVCKSPAARQLAEGAMLVLGGMVNIAPQGTATSPDGLEKDGEAGGDQAAIDGDPATYWDEADGQKLYRLVVTFKQPEKVAAISILGYAHHNYAPKDFEIVCDGRVVKKVENAQYDDNFLLLRLDEVTCTSVELKITGYYGNSPAIRELGIYRAKTQK
jgi:HEAT repeat protein